MRNRRCRHCGQRGPYWLDDGIQGGGEADGASIVCALEKRLGNMVIEAGDGIGPSVSVPVTL